MPFLIMLISPGFLNYHIMKSRFRLLNLANQRDRIKLSKDIKLSVSLVLFNLSFLLLNLPHSIYHMFSTNIKTDLHDAFYYLSLFSFSIDFYILFFSNTIFRKGVLMLFYFKTKPAVISSGATSYKQSTNSGRIRSTRPL